MSKQNKGARRKGNRSSHKHAKTLRRRARISERTRRETEGEDGKLSLPTMIEDAPDSGPAPGEEISNEDLERRIEEQEREIERFSRSESEKIRNEMDISLADARETVRKAHEAMLKRRCNDLSEVEASQVLTSTQVRNLKREIGDDITHSKAVIASLDREWNDMLRMDVISAIHPASLSGKEIKPYYVFSLLRRARKAFVKRVPNVHIPTMQGIVEALHTIMVETPPEDGEEQHGEMERWSLFIEVCLRLSMSILESDLQRYAPIVWYTLLRSIVQMERQGRHAQARSALVSYLEQARVNAGDIDYRPAFITTPEGEEQYRQRLAHYLRQV